MKMKMCKHTDIMYLGTPPSCFEWCLRCGAVRGLTGHKYINAYGPSTEWKIPKVKGKTVYEFTRLPETML